MIVASVSSHNTGTTQWMDPRLAQLKKATVDECDDDGKQTKFWNSHTQPVQRTLRTFCFKKNKGKNVKAKSQ